MIILDVLGMKEKTKTSKFTFRGAAYGLIAGIILSVFFGLLFPATDPSEALKREYLFAILVYPVTTLIGGFAHPVIQRKGKQN